MEYKLKLDTNGSRPDVVRRLLDEQLVDFVAMDIKTSLENYHLALPKKPKSEKPDPETILETARLLMEHAPDYEFRTTCCRPFISGEIMEEIGEMIHGAKQYVLQNCSKNVNVLDPEFLKPDTTFFSETRMSELKIIIERHVSRALLR